MDDATIRKYAKQVWWWVNDETTISRVNLDTIAFQSEYDWGGPNYTSVDIRAYQFMPLDGPAIVLRLAFGREINTVFVREDTQEGY